MLIDTRIIQRHAGYEVLAHCVEIVWPNKSTIGLHPVRFNGHDDMFLRALQHDDLQWIIVDLREVAPTLGIDIKALPRRDTDGLVLHTLRLRFSGAHEFRLQAVAQYKTAWRAAAKRLPMGAGMEAAA